MDTKAQGVQHGNAGGERLTIERTRWGGQTDAVTFVQGRGTKQGMSEHRYLGSRW